MFQSFFKPPKSPTRAALILVGGALYFSYEIALNAPRSVFELFVVFSTIALTIAWFIARSPREK